MIYIKLGEFRAEYMAQVRREAFKEKFGREPSFTTNLDDFGYPKDFRAAQLLVDDERYYAIFEDLVNQKLRQLRPLPFKSLSLWARIKRFFLSIHLPVKS